MENREGVMSLAELGLSLPGSNYGSTRPSIDFPQLIDWYMRGMLYLDPLIARRFALPEIGAAFGLLKTGTAARGRSDLRSVRLSCVVPAACPCRDRRPGQRV